MIFSTKLIMAVLAYDAALAVAGVPNAINAGVANIERDESKVDQVNGIVERDDAMTVTVTMTDCGPAPAPSASVPAPSVTSVNVSVPEVTTAVPTGSAEVPPSAGVPTGRPSTGVPTSVVSSTESTSASETHTSATRETTHATHSTATQTVAKPTPSDMATRHVGFHAILAGIVGAAVFAAL